MKVLKEGKLNWANVCESSCGWCGTRVQFYLDKGDKRVSHMDGSVDHIKYICPVCGERNTNVIGEPVKAVCISREYRKLTMQEYEEEVKPIINEDVNLSDEDKAWLTDCGYIYV